jgi:hypothetical protein
MRQWRESAPGERAHGKPEKPPHPEKPEH